MDGGQRLEEGSILGHGIEHARASITRWALAAPMMENKMIKDTTEAAIGPMAALMASAAMRVDVAICPAGRT